MRVLGGVGGLDGEGREQDGRRRGRAAPQQGRRPGEVVHARGIGTTARAPQPRSLEREHTRVTHGQFRLPGRPAGVPGMNGKRPRWGGTGDTRRKRADAEAD
ncbi:hypothetical protein ACE1SV_11230 [Streptomyces sennicomposti]